jgi:putative ABC transport system permease protein
VYDVRTMNEVVGRSVTPRWLIMAVLGFFAMSSLLLATVGLYGVVAYTVTQRAREFGVRLALGAARSDVMRLVVVRGSRLAAIGAVIGLGAAVLLTVGMERMLYGVTPLDPVSFAASGAGLFGVALLASYLPARRASLTDPARTLRADV